MTDQIRRYGPGKFNTVMDAYVYDVSCNGGCDEEAGSVDENGAWYGLMRNGHTIFKDHDPLLETLNEAEQELLTNSAGVILQEDGNGFVTVSYYETKAELDKDWASIEEEMASYEETDEDE